MSSKSEFTWYGHVILIRGHLILTGINWPSNSTSKLNSSAQLSNSQFFWNPSPQSTGLNHLNCRKKANTGKCVSVYSKTKMIILKWDEIFAHVVHLFQELFWLVVHSSPNLIGVTYTHSLLIPQAFYKEKWLNCYWSSLQRRMRR